MNIMEVRESLGSGRVGYLYCIASAFGSINEYGHRGYLRSAFRDIHPLSSSI